MARGRRPRATQYPPSASADSAAVPPAQATGGVRAERLGHRQADHEGQHRHRCVQCPTTPTQQLAEVRLGALLDGP